MAAELIVKILYMIPDRNVEVGEVAISSADNVSSRGPNISPYNRALTFGILTLLLILTSEFLRVFVDF